MNGPIRRKLDINCTVWGHQKGDVQFYLFEDLLRSVFSEGKKELIRRKNNTILWKNSYCNSFCNNYHCIL